MNSKRIAIILIAVISFTVIIIHDLRPYSEDNYEIQHDSVTSHHDIFLINYQQIIVHEIQSLISQPPYHTIETVILSSTINNLTIQANSNGSFLFADYGRIPLVRVYDNETLILHDVEIPSDSFTFYLRYDVENTTIIGTMSLTIEYTLELMFKRPPKFMVSQLLFQLFPEERDILGVGVILFGLIIAYISIKIIKQSD